MTVSYACAVTRSRVAVWLDHMYRVVQPQPSGVQPERTTMASPLVGQHRRFPRPRDLLPLLSSRSPCSTRRADGWDGADDRGPAADRQAAHAQGGVRLHRRGGRGRGVAGAGAPGVRGHRVPPGDPARRRRRSTPSREVLGGPVGAAVRHRADRLHPDDADRGRDRRRAAPPGRPASRSRSRRWAPPRSRTSRRRTRRTQLVPALHVEGPRPLDGAGRPGRRGGLRHAARHRRRPGRRRAAARHPQRDDDPADPDAPHGAQRDPAAGLVVQLPHHRAAGLRLAATRGRARSRSCSTRCSTRR